MIEAVIVSIFSLEYILSLGSVGAVPLPQPHWLLKCQWPVQAVLKPVLFVFHPISLIDLLSILPFFAALVLPRSSTIQHLKIFRNVRLLRVLRLVKIVRKSPAMQVLFQAVQKSSQM